MNETGHLDMPAIHAAGLDILKAFADLCEKHGLTYTIYCGTLLGAVRHGGFIPWDDDVDIAMPLKDYRRFQKLAHELPERFECCHLGITREFNLLWTKISASGTTSMPVEAAALDIPWGISLDIYPMIGAFEGERGLKLQQNLLLTARRLRSADNYRVRRETGRMKSILSRVPFFLRKGLSDLLLRIAMRDPEKSRRVGTLDAAEFKGKFDREDWTELMPLRFEDREFAAPVRYDKVLRIMYADYMQLPPEEKRIPHISSDGKTIIDPHRDYRLYRNELLEKEVPSEKEQPAKSRIYQMSRGLSVDPVSGSMIDEPGTSANFLPYPVTGGSRVSLKDSSCRFRVFFYTPDIPPELIHTYCYQNESNWTTFSPALSSPAWTERPFTVPRDGFIRAAVNSLKRQTLTEAVSIEPAGKADTPVPEWMRNQIDDLGRRVSALRRPGDLTLMILTDTHAAAGGIWEDTLRSLHLAAETVKPDAVIHLGDFSDGLLPGEQTSALVRYILQNLKEICGKLYCCVGNHDYNYYQKNPDRFTRELCAELYLGRKEPWYFIDAEDKRLRLIFLDSFDPSEKERYGFPTGELDWIRQTLAATPAGWNVIFFSHVPPAAEIHVWSDTIRNGEAMLETAARFDKQRGGCVLGWVHGHNHADLVYEKRAFPIVGIGCSKLEDFREHKPDGSDTWDRIRNSDSQELWDVLLVHPEEKSMDFLRFGAGEDRHTEIRKPL